jgi:hypothetical protein
VSFAPGQPGEFADFPWLIAVALGLFFLAALANVITLALFEREIDTRESPNTVVLSLGTDRSEFLLYIVLILSVAGTAVSLATIKPNGFVAFALILLGATANVPLGVYRNRAIFGKREYYRSVCDGVFLLYALPALLALCY